MEHEILERFVAETWTNLDRLDAVVNSLRHDGGQPSRLREVRELLNEIKASCGFLGLRVLSGLIQRACDILRPIRDRATADQIDELRDALRAIRSVVGTIEATREEPADLAAPKPLTEQAPAPAQSPPVAEQPAAAPPRPLETVVERSHVIDDVEAKFAARTARPGREVLLVSKSKYLHHLLAAALESDGCGIAFAPDEACVRAYAREGRRFESIVTDADGPALDDDLLQQLLRDGAAKQSVLKLARTARSIGPDLPRYDCSQLAAAVRGKLDARRIVSALT